MSSKTRMRKTNLTNTARITKKITNVSDTQKQERAMNIANARYGVRESELMNKIGHIDKSAPDIVLFISAHGEVLTNEPIRDKIFWHSTSPVNGCLLFADKTIEESYITFFKEAYDKYQTESNKHQKVLNDFCELYNKTEDITWEFFDSIRYNIELLSFVLIHMQHGKSGTSDTLPQNYIDEAQKIVRRLNSNTRISNLFKSLKTDKKKVYENSLKTFMSVVDEIISIIYKFHLILLEDPQEDETHMVPRFCKAVKFIYIYKYMYDNYHRHGIHNFLCKKFMRLKKNKIYQFHDKENMIPGIFVLFLSPAAAAAEKLGEVLEPSEVATVQQIRLSVFPGFTSGSIKLNDIIEFLQTNIGYKKIAIYDKSCNYTEESTQRDAPKISPLARDLTQTNQMTMSAAAAPATASFVEKFNDVAMYYISLIFGKRARAS